MKKILENLNEKQLIKMATEKAWKQNKDKVASPKRLKQMLRRVLRKEREFFMYSWKINDCRDYGVMYGDEYEKYKSILRKLNYTQNYSNYDSKFTKEVDSSFVWDKDYCRSNIALFNYVFDTNFDIDFYTEERTISYKQGIQSREEGKAFVLPEKARNFLKNAGYSIYKQWWNLGKGFKLPKFIVF